MSANNYLEITRVEREYVISILCADTGTGSELRREKSLKKAIIWAEDYQQENTVEYGIHFGNIIKGE